MTILKAPARSGKSLEELKELRRKREAEVTFATLSVNVLAYSKIIILCNDISVVYSLWSSPS